MVQKKKLKEGKGEGILYQGKKSVTRKAGPSGITLVALVVTIVVLLILAGITIMYTMGDNSIFKIAQEAKEKTKAANAKEKLEGAFADLTIKKYSDTMYNQNKYIDQELERQGIMKISEDIFSVDNYQFQIDRSVPKIIQEFGEGKLNENIEIVANQEIKEKCTISFTTITIKSDTTITEVKVDGKEITPIEKNEDKYTVTVNLDKNGSYNILAKDGEKGYNIKSIVVNEIADSMDINNIEDWNKFNAIAQKGGTFAGKTVTLQATEIDLKGKNHTPIPDFEGTFEGKNHKIKNLTINRTENNNGLFAVTHNATIQNLTLTDVDINGAFRTGSLVGNMLGGNINNITVNGSVKSTNQHVGGVIGAINTSNVPTNIKNVKANVNVSTDNSTSSISNIGGLIGLVSATGVNISDCSVVGSITCNGGDTAGGFIGFIGEIQSATYFEPTRIERCFSKATVQGGNLVGGFIGYTNTQSGCNAPYYAYIEDCYCIGSVTGTTSVGGFLGASVVSVQSLNVSFKNCFCSTPVTGTNAYTNGAFFGFQSSGNITFSECYFDKTVSGVQTTWGTSVGRTTTEMQTPSNFSSWSTDVWIIEQGKYPALSSS